MSEYEAARAVAIAFEARIILADDAALEGGPWAGWEKMTCSELAGICDVNVAFDQARELLGIRVVDFDHQIGLLNDAMGAYEQMWLTNADRT